MKHLQADLDSLFKPTVPSYSTPPLYEYQEPPTTARLTLKTIENSLSYWRIDTSVASSHATVSKLYHELGTFVRYTRAEKLPVNDSRSAFLRSWYYVIPQSLNFRTRDEAILYLILNDKDLSDYQDDVPKLHDQYPEYFI